MESLEKVPPHEEENAEGLGWKIQEESKGIKHLLANGVDIQ